MLADLVAKFCFITAIFKTQALPTLEHDATPDEVEKVKEILYGLKTDYELVVPFISDSDGIFIDYNVSVAPKTLQRKRRSSYTSHYEDLNVMIPTKDGLLHLVLQPTSALVSPEATVESIEGNITERRHIQEDCFFQGGLSRANQSFAAISTCKGLNGVLKTHESGEEFFIEPVSTDPDTGGITHALYKKPILKYLKEQGVPDDLLMFSDIELDDMLLPDLAEEGMPTKSRRKRRAAGQTFLEVMVAVDPTVVNFHGRDLVDTYVLTLMNIVNSVYHHYTLGVKLNVVVVKIHLMNRRTHEKVMHRGSPKKTLDNFCEWANDVNPPGDDDPNHHDHAVYLTRDEFGPAGYAPVTGMCRPDRSCAVIKDDGLSSAFVVAHETGHVLGMEHDGSRNRCVNKPNAGNIMAPLVQSNFHRFFWTECSKHVLSQYISSYTCLRDSPFEKAWPQLLEPYGVAWSLDEQCRQEFGDGYELCYAFRYQDPCRFLWCGDIRNPLICKTKKGPPLPGTDCAVKRWCMDGKCVPKNSSIVQQVSSPLKIIPPIDGGWSVWSQWGACSRTCGASVKYRTRRCDNPEPAHYGKECLGNGWEHGTCSLSTCPDGVVDFRAEQCSKYNRGPETWRPAPARRPDDWCKLTCEDETSGALFVSEDYVIDGTPCTYDDRYSICVKGKCQKYGCDRKINSTKQDDMCGECEGENNKCKKVDGVYERTLNTGYHKVLKLAKGTRHVNIQKPYSPFYLTVKDNQVDKYYVNPVTKQTTEAEFIARGSKFKYIYNGEELLTADGPLTGDIDIEAYSLYDDVAFSMRYEYVVPLDEDLIIHDPKKRYKWQFSSWTECSKTCGTGVHKMTFVCKDQLVGEVLESEMCKDSKQPRAEVRTCNTAPCPHFRYATGDFGECTKSCGPRGVQLRTVVCMKVEPNQAQRQVSDFYCTKLAKPDSMRKCNRVPCEVEWTVGKWSECSVSCGNGVQVRKIACDVSPNGDYYKCTGRPPVDSKICAMPTCRTTTRIPSTTTSTTTTARTTTSTTTMTPKTTETLPQTTERSTQVLQPIQNLPVKTTITPPRSSTTSTPTTTTTTPTPTTKPTTARVPPNPPTPKSTTPPRKSQFTTRCFADRSFFCKLGANIKNCRVVALTSPSTAVFSTSPPTADDNKTSDVYVVTLAGVSPIMEIANSKQGDD